MSTPSTRFLNTIALLSGLVLTMALSLACGGGGGGSSTATSTPPVTTAPAAPQGVTASGADRQVSLAWSASSGATGYKVKRAGVSGGPYTEVAAPTATNYTNTGLINDTPYYYVVSATNSGGESANSAQASATPSAPINNADLSALTLSVGTLSPSFAAATNSYTSSVANAVTSVTVTPTKAASGGSITVQGVTVASGTASAPIALVVGANPITVIVTAQDGTTQKTYTIAVTRGSGGSGGGIVSRTSGVAPLSVHFWAGFLEHADVSTRFRNYDFTWDFGDPGSGTWGTTGKSKNRAKGGIGVHVYETPGTYTATLVVRDASGPVATESYEITVLDPDTFYSGTKTTCVNPAGDTNFTGAPAGSRQLSTNDLSTITQYATAGSRILFKRGASWTTMGLTWPNNAGPVTIGAYGTGANPDSLGIFANAPVITLIDNPNVSEESFLPLDRKQDWRIMDLHFVDPTRTNGVFGGAMEMQRHLFLRLRIEGFGSGLGWSHWNTSLLMTLDDMAVVSCNVSDAASNVLYVGGERLALLGNIINNARESHVTRVWQAYRSVISDNMMSGSSLDSGLGRHALKLHGPGYSTLAGVNEYGTPVPGTGLLANRTEYCIVSDNTFGSSGPWPVGIGPQDSLTDSQLLNIIFERNRIITQYGAQSSTNVQVALHVWGRYMVLRNNVFDGTGSSNDYTAIVVERRGAEPTPLGIELYHNTIYRDDNVSGNHRKGMTIGADASGTLIRNNLVVFPGATVPLTLIEDHGTGTVMSNNLLNGTVTFTDPTNANPLLRSFILQPGSTGAINQGYTVTSVLEDFAGNTRPIGGAYDIGAFER